MRDTVLFDLDETLLDRVGSLRDFACWQARGMLRTSIEDENKFCDRFIELDANGSVWKDQVYARLVEEFKLSGWSVSELLSSYELCFCGFCKFKPNACFALQYLYENGYKLGLVSNGKSPFQERNFNALGVKGLFGTVVVSEAVGFRKPDPEIFALACDDLDASPEKVIFVGDNPVADIQGANNLGMYTIYIPGNYGLECNSANAVCTDYRDFPGIVDKAT